MNLPAEDQLTLATQVDIKYADKLDPQLIKDVQAFLKSRSAQIDIVGPVASANPR